MRRLLACSIATTALATAAAPALADSGAITNVQATGTGTIAATFTAEWSSCKDYGYDLQECSWTTWAYDRPASEQCLPDQGSSIWVGSSHSAPGSETATATFYPDIQGPLRLCLYVEAAGASGQVLVAQTVYTPPTLTPGQARKHLQALLRRRYGKRFTHGTHRALSCNDPSAGSVTCSAIWRYKRLVYGGSVKLTPMDDGVRSEVSIYVHRA